MWKCPDCDGIVSDNMDFCTSCGAYSKDRSVHVEASDIKTPMIGQKRPSFMTIIIIFVSMMMIFSVMSSIFTPPPEKGSSDDTVTWNSSGVEFSFTYEISDELYDKAKDSKITRDGAISYVSDYSKGIYSPADFIVVDEFMMKLCNDLYNLYIEKMQTEPSLNSDMAFAQYILDFVQSAVEYTEDSEQNKQEEYWSYPVETLYSGKGDCEDSSILLTAMYEGMRQIQDCKFNILGTAFVLLPSHAMSSVDIGEYKDGSFYVEYDGKQYMVCETTNDDFVIGDIAESYVSSVYDTYSGFVTKYV